MILCALACHIDPSPYDGIEKLIILDERYRTIQISMFTIPMHVSIICVWGIQYNLHAYLGLMASDKA